MRRQQMSIPGLTALTSYLTDILTALERTSLLFWQDREAPTWRQSVTLFTGQWIFYALAQFGYAGDGPLVGTRYSLLLVFIVVALVLIFWGPSLGPVSHFGPSLLRLISVALALGSAAISLNGLWRWVELLRPLPEGLGSYRGTTCLVSGLLATTLLMVYTLRSQEESALTPWGKLSVVAFLLLVTTSVLLYLIVIPHAAS